MASGRCLGLMKYHHDEGNVVYSENSVSSLGYCLPPLQHTKMEQIVAGRDSVAFGPIEAHRTNLLVGVLSDRPGCRSLLGITTLPEGAVLARFKADRIKCVI